MSSWQSSHRDDRAPYERVLPGSPPRRPIFCNHTISCSRRLQLRGRARMGTSRSTCSRYVRLACYLLYGILSSAHCASATMRASTKEASLDFLVDASKHGLEGLRLTSFVDDLTTAEDGAVKDREDATTRYMITGGAPQVRAFLGNVLLYQLQSVP